MYYVWSLGAFNTAGYVCVICARAPPSGAPCAIAGMFGCAPAASDEEYNRFDGMHPDDGHAWLVAHPFY